MNILLFLKNLQGRGVSKVYLNLAKALKKFGHNPIIVLRENIIEFEIPDIDIFIFDKNTTLATDNLIKERNIDFIISNNVSYLEKIKNLDKNRIFYTVHMLWSKRIFKNLRLKKLFQLKKEYKDKNIIAVSNAVKNDLLNKIRIKPKKIEVIYDIFDFEEIEQKSKEFEINNKYILHVGAFSKEKNHKLLLDLYSKLDTDLELWLIGKGKLEKKIKDYAKKLRIDKKVKFLGFKKNPYPYIRNAKILLITSTDEALPGTAIESLYLNTPVISTDNGGIREILDSKYISNDKTTLIKLINETINKPYKIDKNQIKSKFGFDIIQQYEKIWSNYE
jgi:glycosyltransferase involved in cell wall biosynthesis